MSIRHKLQTIISFLACSRNGAIPPPAGPVPALFRPGERDDASVARNLAAAFIMTLAGPSVPGHGPAARYLEEAESPAGAFLRDGIALIRREVEERYSGDEEFRACLDALHGYASSPGADPRSPEAEQLTAAVFFPEGVYDGGVPAAVSRLREKRSVRVTGLNPRPITSPGSEVLFTSNILLTIQQKDMIDATGCSADVKHAFAAAAGEEQAYWYDHPMPVGAAPGENEALHGLKGLADALAFEERAGNKEPGRNIDFVCSLSVTHRGLREAGREWLGSEIARAGALRGINLHLFTEGDCCRLLDEVILPAARRYCPGRAGAALPRVFGVDGEYGRHYSFLKAIARFWQVFISPGVRATFKIDLDQVFPQEEMVRETGASAFGHLRTPLWGARCTDYLGREVYLGMIAGALVNRTDIGASLFSPDVTLPGSPPAGDEVLFRSRVPQALSTMAEMGRFSGPGALQRVHVTGGTTGILVEALKLYRPFTLSCAGRAEDQAYMLSVLFKHGEHGLLRYAHAPGLVMRHDADLFAGAAGAARTGKILGDYIRTLLFTGYAGALPWPECDIKREIDPFTGCFVSRLPITIVLMRYALKTEMLFASGSGEEGLQLFNEGAIRLRSAITSYILSESFMRETFRVEREAWDLYYDALDEAEKGLSAGDPFARGLAVQAQACVNSVKIKG